MAQSGKKLAEFKTWHKPNMETLQRTANRGSISTGYDIDNSLKLEPDNSEYLSRNPSTDTNRQTFTFSTWIKRTELGQNARLIDVYSNGANFTTFGFDTSDRMVVYAIDGGIDYGGHYTQRFRDTSAWYHIVWKSDITNATAANRWQIYVNGVEVTGKDIDYGTPPTNFYTLMNTTFSTKVGYNTDGSNGSSQYMAETHLVDGTALAPTEFGEYDEDSGIWKPKAYTGSYGTNGFYLDFESSGSLGADSSGNGNNFTLNNIGAGDQAQDSPTNNFAIPNVIGTTRINAFTYTEGGTKVIHNGGSDWNSWANTMAVGSGKWYAEFKIIGGNSHFVGVGSEDYYFVGAGSGTGFPEIYYGYSGTNSVGYHNTNGDIYNNGTQVVISGSNYTTNDIISVALDMDNGKVYFAKNGTYINSQNPVTGTNSISLPDTSARYFIGTSHYTSNIGAECNYGGYTSFSIASAASDSNNYGTFEYAPPSGYYALCTKNLAEYG